MPHYVSDKEDVVSTTFGTTLRFRPGIPVFVNDPRVETVCLQRGIKLFEVPVQKPQEAKQEEARPAEPVVTDKPKDTPTTPQRPIRRRLTK
jgi:hypothetical protein